MFKSLQKRKRDDASGVMVNAMSVDVEDYFQVEAFRSVFPTDSWDKIDCRIERNVDRILGIFDEAGVHATFFVLGWIAERFPQVVRRIAAGGHEVASHGYSHRRATEMSPAAFRDDVSSAKRILEDQCGRPVSGYRAPTYSIVRSNLWALGVLEDAGYSYSSSIYPVRHDLYGIHDAPRFAFRSDNLKISELPITTIRILGQARPCGGGGFFRLYPYAISRWALNSVNRNEWQPAIFYFHPWELDLEQPRVPTAPLKSRIRHYLGLSRMEPRLRNLLRDFRWDRMDRVFLPELSQ